MPKPRNSCSGMYVLSLMMYNVNSQEKSQADSSVHVSNIRKKQRHSPT